jgi:esterase/lipase superfamily enzyme
MAMVHFLQMTVTVVVGRSYLYPNLLPDSSVVASSGAFVLAEFVGEYCNSDVVVSVTVLGIL